MDGAPSHSPQRLLIILVFAAFVSIGLPDALFGVSWPTMKIDFDINNASLIFLNVPGALSYMASSALSRHITKRIGVSGLLIGSTVLQVIGLSIYASAPRFWVVPCAILFLGFGAGAIDAALNLLVAERFPVRIMSWLHAFFGIGALVGPFLMAGVFSAGATWRMGYVIMAGVLAVLALIFLAGRNAFPREEADHPTTTPDADADTAPDTPIDRRAVVLNVALFMADATAECLMAGWVASMLYYRFHFGASTAGVWTGVYWISLTASRLVVPIFTARVRSETVIQWSAAVAVLGTIGMALPSDVTFRAGIVLFGVGIASIFPTAMSLTPQRLGKRAAKHAVGYQVTASTFMFMLLPSASGWVIDHASYRVPVWGMLAGSLGVLLINGLLMRIAPTDGHPPVLPTESEFPTVA